MAQAFPSKSEDPHPCGDLEREGEGEREKNGFHPQRAEKTIFRGDIAVDFMSLPVKICNIILYGSPQ